MHVWGTYDAPGIAFPAGNLMACCHGFTIEVEGKSAHASAPHEGVDAVMVASSILQSIQQLVSRMNDPLNPLVITVGKVTAGNRWNVLAGHATLEGTVRTFLTGTQVEDALRKVAECTAAAFGAKATLSYQYMTEPVINSDEHQTLREGIPHYPRTPDGQRGLLLVWQGRHPLYLRLCSQPQ